MSEFDELWDELPPETLALILVQVDIIAETSGKNDELILGALGDYIFNIGASKVTETEMQRLYKIAEKQADLAYIRNIEGD